MSDQKMIGIKKTIQPIVRPIVTCVGITTFERVVRFHYYGLGVGEQSYVTLPESTY